MGNEKSAKGIFTVQEIAKASCHHEKAIQLWITRGIIPQKRIKLKAHLERNRYLIKGEDLKTFFLKVLRDKSYWELTVKRLSEQRRSQQNQKNVV